MARKDGKPNMAKINYVRKERENERACNRPDRIPGRAPNCEDAHEILYRPISLAKLSFMESEENGDAGEKNKYVRDYGAREIVTRRGS